MAEIGRWSTLAEALFRLRRFNLNMYATPDRCRDVDERVQRKAGDTSAHQIVDPRLGDAAMSGGLLLRPAALRNYRGDLLHEFGASAHICRLLRSICNCVPYAGVGLDSSCLFHRCVLISWLNRRVAILMSRFEVVCVFFWNACNT